MSFAIKHSLESFGYNQSSLSYILIKPVYSINKNKFYGKNEFMNLDLAKAKYAQGRTMKKFAIRLDAC